MESERAAIRRRVRKLHERVAKITLELNRELDEVRKEIDALTA